MSYEHSQAESLRNRMSLVTRGLTGNEYRISRAAIGDVSISHTEPATIGEHEYQMHETFSSWQPVEGSGYGFHLARTYQSHTFGSSAQITVTASARAEATDLDTIHDTYVSLRDELTAKIAALISREGEE